MMGRLSLIAKASFAIFFTVSIVLAAGVSAQQWLGPPSTLPGPMQPTVEGQVLGIPMPATGGQIVRLAERVVQPDAAKTTALPLSKPASIVKTPDADSLRVARQPSVATPQMPGWYPYVIARGNDRAIIQNTPIEQRPNRPLHFYGNRARRNVRGR